MIVIKEKNSAIIISAEHRSRTSVLNYYIILNTISLHCQRGQRFDRNSSDRRASSRSLSRKFTQAIKYYYRHFGHKPVSLFSL